MATRTPLRTALIGLSANSTSSWAAVAHLPNYLTDAGKERFNITALLNSSVSNAQLAIKEFGLPAETKAYGNPEDLANDPDIDLVVTNTRVDRHYETTLASIKAGKHAYIEWPVAAKQEHIKELVAAAKASGSKVAIGLQARLSPPISKLREIVESKRFGKILNSTVSGYSTMAKIPASLKYFLDRDVGGNFITIIVAHIVDTVQSVVGELDTKVDTRLEILRPNVGLTDKTGAIVETAQTNVPDFASIHGLIKSPHAAPNAVLSAQFQCRPPFPGSPSLNWHISLERGEIRFVSQDSMNVGTSSAYNNHPPTIEVHDFESGKVEKIEWDWDDGLKEVPIGARSVGKSLYAFADELGAPKGWIDINEAARRAEQLEGWLVASGF